MDGGEAVATDSEDSDGGTESDFVDTNTGAGSENDSDSGLWMDGGDGSDGSDGDGGFDGSI